jgi:hypothetical protein
MLQYDMKSAAVEGICHIISTFFEQIVYLLSSFEEMAYTLAL